MKGSVTLLLVPASGRFGQYKCNPTSERGIPQLWWNSFLFRSMISSFPSWDAMTFLQISSFFLFSSFGKGRLLYIRPVGLVVGWSTSSFIFSIYTGIRAFINPVPLNTNHYQVILTQYHQVTTSIAPYWPSSIKYQPVLPCKDPVLKYIKMSIGHNSKKEICTVCLV